MILSDRTLRERVAAGSIGIDPFDADAVQPASIDLRLGDAFRVFTRHKYGFVDLARRAAGPHRGRRACRRASSFALHPGEFALGSTRRARGRAGRPRRPPRRQEQPRPPRADHPLDAGYIDPGFEGQITLELSNVATVPIMLHPGMRVAQISFLTMTTPADRPYASPGLHSKYQGQTGPTQSRLRLTPDANPSTDRETP